MRSAGSRSRDEPLRLRCKVEPSFRRGRRRKKEGSGGEWVLRVTKQGSRGGKNVSVEVEEDGLTFCFRAPVVFNDNEDVITFEGDSDRVGGKIWAKGCGTWTATRKRV